MKAGMFPTSARKAIAPTHGSYSWASGQDQTIDDVAGSIWKRSWLRDETDAAAGRIESLLKSDVWQAPGIPTCQ